jgi:antitoxin component YwqK of YwqJK toxin-antitoxin module
MSKTDNHNFTGVYREYYDEEQTKQKLEVFMHNDKREGIYKSYHSNGQLYEEVNYIDGKREGEYKSYYGNGQLGEEMNYIDGKREGIYKSYYMNGQLYEEVNYINGEVVE